MRRDARPVRRGIRRGVRQPRAEEVSTGGLFIGGGIAPKILQALTTGSSCAFLAKPPLEAMLAAMPVKVILNAEAGLLGAAVFAGER